MPLLPPTADRVRLHQRSVKIDGYRRADGMWDLEAHLVDCKDQPYRLASGVRQSGEAVHDLWVRVTIDSEMNILAAEASADATPYPGFCDTITPAYRRVVGLNLFRGFRPAVRELLGGTHGCAHLSELLMFLPTAALQTFASEISEDDGQGGKPPYQIDRCHALVSESDAVKRYYPRWYRDQSPGQGA